MVKFSLIIKTILVGILTIVFPLMSQAQQREKRYSELQDYRKWSIVVGPSLYNKASITPQYGDYTIENKPMLGFNAGFEYDFYPDAKWSFITGLYCAIEPVYNLQFTLKEEDIFFDEDYPNHFKSYTMLSFSCPLLLRLNIRAGNRSFISFLTGLKAMYFPEGEAELTLAISSEELDERREVFGLRVVSPENYVQGSFVIGAGFSYAMNKALLKANIVYVMNFQNTMSGEYLFGNLLTSADSRGYYELSGNYLELQFSVSLKKGKKKNKILMQEGR